eukprot:m.668078 g.668078  ORF g.668078 m.668078 type:complete len:956 (-) comp22754_c0_seq1:2063-4930(-)
MATHPMMLVALLLLRVDVTFAAKGKTACGTSKGSSGACITDSPTESPPTPPAQPSEIVAVSSVQNLVEGSTSVMISAEYTSTIPGAQIRFRVKRDSTLLGEDVETIGTGSGSVVGSVSLNSAVIAGAEYEIVVRGYDAGDIVTEDWVSVDIFFITATTAPPTLSPTTPAPSPGTPPSAAPTTAAPTPLPPSTASPTTSSPTQTPFATPPFPDPPTDAPPPPPPHGLPPQQPADTSSTSSASTESTKPIDGSGDAAPPPSPPQDAPSGVLMHARSIRFEAAFATLFPVESDQMDFAVLLKQALLDVAGGFDRVRRADVDAIGNTMTFTFDADGVGFSVEAFVSSTIVAVVDAAIAGGGVCVTFKGQVLCNTPYTDTAVGAADPGDTGGTSTTDKSSTGSIILAVVVVCVLVTVLAIVSIAHTVRRHRAAKQGDNVCISPMSDFDGQTGSNMALFPMVSTTLADKGIVYHEPSDTPVNGEALYETVHYDTIPRADDEYTAAGTSLGYMDSNQLHRQFPNVYDAAVDRFSKIPHDPSYMQATPRVVVQHRSPQYEVATPGGAQTYDMAVPRLNAIPSPDEPGATPTRHRHAYDVATPTQQRHAYDVATPRGNDDSLLPKPLTGWKSGVINAQQLHAVSPDSDLTGHRTGHVATRFAGMASSHLVANTESAYDALMDGNYDSRTVVGKDELDITLSPAGRNTRTPDVSVLDGESDTDGSPLSGFGASPTTTQRHSALYGAENGINTPGFIARKKKRRLGKQSGDQPTKPRSPLGDVNNYSNLNLSRSTPNHNYSNLQPNVQSPGIGFDYARSPLVVSTCAVPHTPAGSGFGGAATPRADGLRRSPSYSAAISHQHTTAARTTTEHGSPTPHTDSDATHTPLPPDANTPVVTEVAEVAVTGETTTTENNTTVPEPAVRDPKLDGGIPDWKRRLPSYLQMEPKSGKDLGPQPLTLTIGVKK